MKGRQRRLKYFEHRAEAFNVAISKGEGFRETTMNERAVKVGKGKHKRLILKRTVHYNTLANPLMKFIEELEINPAETFTLVKLGFSPKFNIQEYLDKPTAEMLFHFFQRRYLKKSERTLKQSRLVEEALKCKRFINQNKKISFNLLKKALEELDTRAHKDNSQLHNFPTAAVNIIIMGQNRDGKLRLALADY
ncbi:MAG: hypothetical protein WCI04_06105 [archaeon]